MRSRTWYSVLALAVCVPAAAHAQDEIRPGAAELSPVAPAETPTSFHLIVVSGDGERLSSTVARQYALSEHLGHRAYLLVQRYLSPDGTPTGADSTWVRAADLAPLEYRATVGPERHHVLFGPEGARGSVVTPDSTRAVSHPEAAGAFSGVGDDLIIASLPLEVGFAAVLPLYNPPRAVARVRVFVEARDTLVTGDGEREAWRVRYETGVESWFWFDVASGELLRSRTLIPDGSEFWRVRADDVEAWRAARR